MAISVTEILGTDSISGSRIVINDNFSVVSDEINSMEAFFNPVTGLITGLTQVTTDNITVGLTTTRLEISPSSFNVIADVSVTGDIDVAGSVLRNDVNALSITELSPSLDIGGATAVPDKTIYRVSNADTGTLTLTLFDGGIGQELMFVCEATTGPVYVKADAGTTILMGGGNNTISLDEVGDTVHLLSISDDVGNPEWVIIGGNSFDIITS